MNLVRSLDGGNVWAVGRFDALASQAQPARGRRQPDSRRSPGSRSAATSTAACAAIVRAETRDDEAANNLRDVVRGFLALAKLQAGAKPELQPMMQSLELGGTGKTVALSFARARRGVRPGRRRRDKAVKPEAQ